jgi:hypothetical protein
VSEALKWEWYARYKRRGEARLLRLLLERRFGALPVWVDEQLGKATEREMLGWGQGLLSTKLSLEQLLRA